MGRQYQSVFLSRTSFDPSHGSLPMLIFSRYRPHLCLDFSPIIELTRRTILANVLRSVFFFFFFFSFFFVFVLYFFSNADPTRSPISSSEVRGVSGIVDRRRPIHSWQADLSGFLVVCIELLQGNASNQWAIMIPHFLRCKRAQKAQHNCPSGSHGKET